MTNGTALEPLAGPGIVAQIMKQGGTLISALTIIVVTLMVIMLGVRPALRLVAGAPGEGSNALPNLQDADAVENEGEAGAAPMIGAVASPGGEQETGELANPQARLKELVDQDEQQAIMVLKRWSQAPAT